MKTLLIELALVVACSLTTCRSPAAERDLSSAESVSPIITLSGSSTHLKKEALFVLKSAEKLKAVWSKHIGSPADNECNTTLSVDFEQCVVVAAFFGPCVNVRGITVAEVSSSEDAAVVRIVKESYQTAQEGEEAKTPFAFIVLPNTHKKIIVEEGVQSYLGEPLQWRKYDPK